MGKRGVVRTYREQQALPDESAGMEVGRKEIAAMEKLRPKTRDDCREGLRPCPWVSCRHHLFLEITPSGNIRINLPGKEPWELENSCALDMSERGGMTLEDVSRLFSLTRERVRQLEERALHRLERRAGPLLSGLSEDRIPLPKKDRFRTRR